MNHLGTPGIWGKTVFLRSMQLRRNPPGRSPKWLHTRIRILAPDALHNRGDALRSCDILLYLAKPLKTTPAVYQPGQFAGRERRS